MAGFASQAALRSKWGDLVESGSTALPEASEVTQGLKNVVGWLKQVKEILSFLNVFVDVFSCSIDVVTGGFHSVFLDFVHLSPCGCLRSLILNVVLHCLFCVLNHV